MQIPRLTYSYKFFFLLLDEILIAWIAGSTLFISVALAALRILGCNRYCYSQCGAVCLVVFGPYISVALAYKIFFPQPPIRPDDSAKIFMFDAMIITSGENNLYSLTLLTQSMGNISNNFCTVECKLSL